MKASKMVWEPQFCEGIGVIQSFKCWKQEDDKINSEEFGVCDSRANSYIMHVVATLVLIKH